MSTIFLQTCKRGIDVAEETLFFALSTYGIEPENLGSALMDAGLEDRDLLLDLMLFHDNRTRLGVERIVDGSALSKEQQDRIVATVTERIGPIRFMPGTQQPFELEVGEHGVVAMIAKLYLTRSLDADICRSLDTYLPHEERFAPKVMLRCRGEQFTGDESSIVCRVIEAAAQEGDYFLELFGTTLEILAGRQQSMSCEQCLLAKRSELLQSLKGIREFEKKLEQYGMEYLLMQKYPVPTESVELVYEQLRTVTYITDQLLALQPPYGGGIQQRDYGAFSSDQDLDRLFRLLS